MRTYSYDELPYPRQSHPAAHVRKLEAVATLFGMHPQRISKCRVLELGCAAGWNLIPQSLEFPESDFLGVELSRRQVAEGQSVIATLELDNIELREADLLNVDSSWGRFDYILCHGVYSWVAENVREKILAICKDNLSTGGVALVSYNVLPGWNFRGTIRDMMLYHISQFEQPAERISQARAVLDFMVENCPADTAYGQMLREELEIVRDADDQYLYHDHLEDHNTAIYFHQFIEQAEAQGLQYLADANVASMLPKFVSRQARNTLANTPLVKQEQYMDFLRNNTFRTSLLCHEGVDLTRIIGRDVLKNFQVALAARPEPFEASFDFAEPLTVRIGPGKITTDSPLAMALLEQLKEFWPRSIALDELHTATIQRLSASGVSSACFSHSTVDDVAGAIMEIFAAGLLDLYVHAPAIANRVSRRPLATPLARLQASSGSTITNQRHENVTLDEFSRYLVPLLDSQHDRALLSDKVQAAIAKGDLTMQQDRQPVQCVDRKMLDGLVDTVLNGICDASLLTA